MWILRIWQGSRGRQPASRREPVERAIEQAEVWGVWEAWARNGRFIAGLTVGVEVLTTRKRQAVSARCHVCTTLAERLDLAVLASVYVFGNPT